ncbi:uncharacterized protein [Spinacia oleracea]|uniref:Reverse transcriptase domain-containing protein n=1 Tax=Spinacia oleracea TaxID=3562 RepID=A0ABM3RP94_SPIOL|nr:uncharacterized protein LOC110795691 [Spinacia oleracea]
MEDIKCVGNLFTWNNKQQGSSRVFSKTDRIMANHAWKSCFSAAEVCFMPEGHFDHSPGFLSVYPRYDGGKKPFKYFTMWKCSAVFSDIIQKAWNIQISGSKMFILVNKLKRVNHALKDLNKVGFTDVQAADFRGHQNMVAAQSAIQKAKVSWLKDGDENTALFHQSIRSRKVQNQVYNIYDMKGEWKDTTDGVSQAFLDYYKVLLGSTHELRTLISRQVVQQGPVCMDLHKAILNAPYTADEVKKALFSIPGVKALGPDCFGSYFYKDAWHIVGDEVIAAILDMLQQGQLLKEVNHTVITLIPYTKCPKDRIKEVLFMEAYDIVDWKFLHEMLEFLDFPKKFVDMVMQCVGTPMFSLMLNRSMHGFFKSQRGLRQGDPISPLLFFIYVEYLFKILNRMSAMRPMPQFQFHLRCKDLILCSMGDYQSIYLLLRAFKLFSNSAGLKMIYVAQCGHLVDKMITRIKDIVKICRAVLWSGHAFSHEPSNIAWEKVCSDKQTGGLGFRDVLLWNTAFMGKYVWALVNKQDNVWIRWVTSVYLKDGEWWEYL